MRTGFYLLLLCLLLSLLQPPPVLVVPGPVQTVATDHPVLGVHTRLTDEVEEWKIKRSLEMVRAMGAPWIVEFFPWAYYEREKGQIDWEHPDKVISHAAAQGLTVVARIGLTPAWARPPDTPLTYLDETAFGDFAAFAAAFAGRYRDHVDYMVVGNEPNLSFEWGYRQTGAADYVELLATVYAAVKEADPQMFVLAGALAPTLEPPESPWGVNDLTYLEELYAAGMAAHYDGLAVHVYGLTFPPEAAPAPDRLNFRRVELMRRIMEDYGEGHRLIYITETGWNDHPRWTRAVRPGQRIDYTLSAIDYADANWPFVQLVALWAFRFPAPTNSYMDYYTLVTPEFWPKPIYGYLQAYTGNE